MAIEPTIFIAFASLVISLIIAVFNIWRANKADNKEGSSQLTTVIVQLESIKEDTREIKADLKFVPTFSTGKVYLVKKNSAETETLPTVKIKEAYAKAGGKVSCISESSTDIMQRIEILEEQILTLYGESNG